MSQQVRTWIKLVSGVENDIDIDAEKLVVRHADENEIIFEFWDYEGKRSEMIMPTKTAMVLCRAIMLCEEGSLDHIGIDL
ncbi:MAG: hypothetical protein PHF74_06540 [Dehalococcoidales bacterium]|nr:hypothetical protein [Dehalococcoidales bacterium]